jgi:hypothetical protein
MALGVMSEKRREMRWLPMSVGAMVLTAAVLSGSADGAAASTAHRGILLPVALTAIGAARRTLEKMGGCRSRCRPTPSSRLPQQLFVVVNLERTERGLAPAVVLSKSLNAIAQGGARAGRDPAMKSVPTTHGCTTTGLAETTWTAGRAHHGCAGATGITS